MTPVVPNAQTWSTGNLDASSVVDRVDHDRVAPFVYPWLAALTTRVDKSKFVIVDDPRGSITLVVGELGSVEFAIKAERFHCG